MQPCHVCGSMEIDANGYCRQCRTYRGVQTYDVGTPAGGAPYPTYPPSSGAGYGDPAYGGQNPYGDPAGYSPQPSGPPYAGQPSAAPYGAQPSGPPYPTAGGYSQPPMPAAGQLAGPGAAPARRSRTFMVPLIALSVIAVILVCGIVGVILVRASDNAGINSATSSASAGPRSAVDACVVGTWKVTTAKEKVLLEEGQSPVEFTGSGATVRLGADGKGEDDYGRGTVYRATMSGQPVAITFTGKITYDFKTVDGSITYSNVVADGQAIVTVNGATTTTIPLTNESRPARYTCSGSTLVQETELARTELRKS